MVIKNILRIIYKFNIKLYQVFGGSKYKFTHFLSFSGLFILTIDCKQLYHKLNCS
jgi:hypothetical protein